MPITPWVPAITNVSNGTDVSAEVLNPILAQHTQREQHLYEKFISVADKSVLVAFDQPVFNTTDIRKNLVVFYTREVVMGVPKEGLDLAKVSFIVSNNENSFSAGNSTYGIGLVKSLNNDSTIADVYINGLVELDHNIDDSSFGIMQSSETSVTTFTPGPLFLSRTEAGKLTRNPGGIAIYIGYALTRTSLLLAPNVSEFNQFYTTFRFNVLDRPAGKPVLTGSTWSVTEADLTKAGWIGVADLPEAYSAVAPVGSKFFYNIPDPADIDNDTGISEADRDEQKALALALPPNPPNLTMVVVNGVIQQPVDAINSDGLYVVNDYGIWWFADADGQQPWSSDIDAFKTFTTDYTTDVFTLNAHGFEVDDIIQFKTTGTLPAPLVAGTQLPATNYYIIQATTNTFKVSTSKGGSSVNLTNNGSGTHSIHQPYIWKTFRGTEFSRPRTYIQFIRINPSIRDALVTSIKPYNAGSDIIKFYKGDKSDVAATGDLLARLQLAFTEGTPVTHNATAIKSLSYDETTGIITFVNTDVVSNVIQGSGITITEQVVDGVTQEGNFIISAANSNTTGRVSSIEPDGAELLFTGLHSYISMTVPGTLPSSIIGKILIPAGAPTADLTFVMLMIGTETLATDKIVEFEFTYAVSKAGSVLNTAVSTPVIVSFNMPNPYTAKSVFKVGNATGAIATPTFKIPSSAFTGGDAAVNFKLYRKLAGTTPLTTPIGIVDIYWKLG
jgi:hypothetical protein